MKGSGFFLALLFAALGTATRSDNKRLTDSSSTSIRGGGKIGRSRAPDVTADTIPTGADSSDEESLLLQVDPPAAASAPAYTFLSDARYSRCYQNDEEGQGHECNSCWAFAVTNMVNARSCKGYFDAGLNWGASLKLSPLNLICKLQDGGFCATRDIYDALSFIKEEGLLKQVWLSNATFTGSVSGSATKAATVAARQLIAFSWNTSYTALVDPSKPVKKFCDFVFDEKSHRQYLVPVKSVSFSAAPHSSELLKRRLLFGPVVGTIRLTWEFQMFTGSLFNPEGKLTFCRQFKLEDPNDYCDPSHRGSKWDQEQLAQQEASAAEDTWYNHFVAIHGWGVKSSPDGSEGGVPYWVVENSWGRIYENDASLGNNGAGPRYDPLLKYSTIEEKKNLVNKNHFLLVAHRVAGRRGLEMVTREVYSAKM